MLATDRCPVGAFTLTPSLSRVLYLNININTNTNTSTNINTNKKPLHNKHHIRPTSRHHLYRHHRNYLLVARVVIHNRFGASSFSSKDKHKETDGVGEKMGGTEKRNLDLTSMRACRAAFSLAGEISLEKSLSEMPVILPSGSCLVSNRR